MTTQAAAHPSSPVRAADNQDFERHGAAIFAAVIAAQFLVWTLGAQLASANLEGGNDMLENYAWGMAWQAGYFKHPPLFAWITAAWFEVFPRCNLAYFGLSMANSLAGVAGIAALAARFLPRRWAALAALAMMISPAYSNLALKFNANTILLSLWPWAAYFFVRFMQTGERRAALGLGVLCALSMLGKYFSLWLLAALLLTALADREWRRRLVSANAMLAIAAGLAVLAPHLYWLYANDFPTFAYADKRVAELAVPRSELLWFVPRYVLIQLASLLPSLILMLPVLPSRRGFALKLALRETLWSVEQPRLWRLALGPTLAVCAVMVIESMDVSSLWGKSGAFAFSTLWLAAWRRAGIAIDLRRALRLLPAYWIIVLAFSAYMGYTDAVEDKKADDLPLAELARAADAVWAEHEGVPLRIVSGQTRAAMAVAFYSRQRPRYASIKPNETPWITEADYAREGRLIVCIDPATNSDADAEADENCLHAAAGLGEPVAITVRKTAWRQKLSLHRYFLYLQPPPRP